jgi:hypothetical protein
LRVASAFLLLLLLRAGLASLKAARDKIPEFSPVVGDIAFRPAALHRKFDARIVGLGERARLRSLGNARGGIDSTERNHGANGRYDQSHVNPPNVMAHRVFAMCGFIMGMELWNYLPTGAVQFFPISQSTRPNISDE